MGRCLSAADPENLLGLRDRSILELLYSIGIRRREPVKLNLSDFSFAGAELLIANPKGKKDRPVPEGEAARRYTKAYRRLVRHWMVCGQLDKALFVSHRGGGRLSLRSVSKIVQKAAQAGGVTKRISPHSFCHAMAAHLLRNQADLRKIQDILGHAQITSTELYTHLALEDLKEAARRSHPHRRRKD
jgi:integrase/recombinase XerD